MAANIQTGISMESIEQAYVEGNNARNNLTVLQMNCDNDEMGDGNDWVKHFGKVCCICDRFIRYNEETFINTTEFKKPVVKNSFHKKQIDDVYNIPRWTKRTLNKQYTQKYFIDDELNPDENIQLLNQMILSPSSYGKVESKKKNGLLHKLYKWFESNGST